MNAATLEQTAKDYDMDFNTVKMIYDHNPDSFYKVLEDVIEKRKQNIKTDLTEFDEITYIIRGKK